MNKPLTKIHPARYTHYPHYLAGGTYVVALCGYTWKALTADLNLLKHNWKLTLPEAHCPECKRKLKATGDY